MRDTDRGRLALHEPDLHLAAPELGPPRLEVDRVLVEAPPFVEVPNVVPDGGRHGTVLQREPRVLEALLQGLEEGSGRGAVDRAMVEGAGESDHRPDGRPAVDP